MRRTGFYFSFDALVALSLIALAFFIVSQAVPDTQQAADIRTSESLRADSVTESALQVALRHPLSDALDDSQERYYRNETALTADDMDRPVLDAIAILYASNQSGAARNLTRTYFDRVLPADYEYRLAVQNEGYDLIYNSSALTDDAPFLARASRLISGISRNRPARGFISRATLTEATERETANVFYGGYVGDGNLTSNVSLPDLDTVRNVTLEGSFSGPFDLSFNGVDAGHFEPDAGNLSADVFRVCTASVNTTACEALQDGDNRVRFNFTAEDRSIGGGTLRIVYNRTTQLEERGDDTLIERKRLHGVDGIINLFSSFHAPGTVNGISGRLHYRIDNRTLFLKIGNATVYEERVDGETTVTLTNDTIHANTSDANLSYRFMSNRTVPIRLGIRNIERLDRRAIADSASIIDVSGSMDGDLLDEAKSAGKTFANIILQAEGNRAGMVAYEAVIDTVHPLSTNLSSLNDTIDGLTADGSTCIGCGILEGISVVTEPKITELLEPGAEWRWNDSYPSSEPPLKNGTNWTDPAYNDSNWSMDATIIGTGPDADTDIGDNGGDTFLRTTFEAETDRYTNYTVYIRSDDAATVHLNGELLDNDTGEHDGRYWNRIIGGVTPSILRDGFERGTLSPNWTQTSGDTDAALVDTICGASEGSEAMILRWGGNQGGGQPRDPVIAETQPLNLSAGDADTLLYDAKRGGGGGCEPPESGEDIHVEYLAANGSWTGLNVHRASDATASWAETRLSLPDAAHHADFRLRYRYPQGSGADNDYWAFDDVRIGQHLSMDPSLVEDGTNTLAVRLKNDGDGELGFDMAVNATERRDRSMIVMSDGEANVETSMEDVPDHNGDGTVDARDHTIEAGCRAQDDHNITVYAVGFGANADNETLNMTADCGGGDYFFSSTGELEEVFRRISQNILNASFVGQQVEVEAGTRISTLYPDSHLDINYTPTRRGAAGTFDLDQRSDRFGGNVSSPKNGSFSVPDGTTVVDAAVTSYSANYWTDRLRVENGTGGWAHAYRLWQYGTEYRDLGDPYTVNVPPAMLGTGTNNVSIDTGVNRTEPRGGSPDNRVLYTLAVSGTVPYGGAFGKAEGGTYTFQTVDGPATIQVGNASDSWNASNDAVDNATVRLLERLDVDDDGVVDFQMDSDDLAIESQDTSGIEWLWGPAMVSLEVWR